MPRTTKWALLVLALLLVPALILVVRARDPRRAAAPPKPSTTAAAAPAAPHVALPSEPSRAAPVPLSAAVVERDESAENGAFEGRVIDWSTSKGVASAELTIARDGSTARAVTDEKGRFHFEPEKPGLHAIALVTAKGYLPFAPEWGHSPLQIVARPGLRVRDVTVYLVPAVDYLAVVLDPSGKPVAGATVTVLGAAHGEQALAPIRDRFTTDARGEAHFNAPDEALIEARHPAWDPGRARLDGRAATSHRVEIRLAAKGTAGPLGMERIAGRVVDAAGSPVAGALVEAQPASTRADDLRASSQATSDASGSFTIEGLDLDRYLLTARRAGFAPGMSLANSGETEVVVTVRRGGALTGRVLAGSASLASFTVTVARREGPIQERTVASRSVIDPDGRFAIPDLAPGDYRVRAAAHGHAPSSPVEVSIPEPPAEAQPITITLSAGAKLTGKVVEAGGGPIPLARVSIDGLFGDASSAVPLVASAISDDQGDFVLAGIPPGSRSIMVAAYAHHMRLLSGMTFAEGATTGPITVDLTPTKEGEEPRIELAGIGAVLVVDDDGLRVQKVIPGGGAEAAGLTAGDLIIAIDGASAASLGFDGSIQKIRGPEGSSVNLSVRRAGAMRDIVAIRKRIRA